MKLQIAIVAVTLTLGACSTAKQEPAAAPMKQYSMHGKIVSVDAAKKSAKIDAGPIGDWMGAMTMDYTIKDDAGLATLTAGSTIDATVFVDGDSVWVGNIKTAADK